MHTMHLIAIEAESPEEAVSGAEEAIEEYGEGDVWDWREVGGRWKGQLAGSNVLAYADNPEEFQSQLDKVRSRRLQEMQFLAQKFSREVVSMESQAKHSLNPSLYAPTHKRRSVIVSEVLQKILSMDKTLPEGFVDGEETDIDTHMAGYYMRKLGSLIADYYITDSGFYDATGCSPAFNDVGKRCKENPSRQYLVVMDLHN